mmetsp:Transcript_34793/g.96205  ORF Transcript_34793/g.96205 Transcript_34793/m.96205 type:complete len:335 (-) Transcript_34793:127-1131(-)
MALVLLLQQRQFDAPRVASHLAHALHKGICGERLGVPKHDVVQGVRILCEEAEVDAHGGKPLDDLLVVNDRLELLPVQKAVAVLVCSIEEPLDLLDMVCDSPVLLVQHDGVVGRSNVEGDLKEDPHDDLAQGEGDDELVGEDKDEVPLANVLSEAPACGRPVGEHEFEHRQHSLAERPEVPEYLEAALLVISLVIKPIVPQHLMQKQCDDHLHDEEEGHGPTEGRDAALDRGDHQVQRIERPDGPHKPEHAQEPGQAGEPQHHGLQRKHLRPDRGDHPKDADDCVQPVPSFTEERQPKHHGLHDELQQEHASEDPLQHLENRLGTRPGIVDDVL